MRGAVRAAARPRRVGLVNGTSRSVVEDRLVHVERLVEPAEAVASPDPLEDRPGQIGARYVGIREIGTGEVGADQQHLAQVRAGQVGAAEVHAAGIRSEESRVGKECRGRWETDEEEKEKRRM